MQPLPQVPQWKDSLAWETWFSLQRGTGYQITSLRSFSYWGTIIGLRVRNVDEHWCDDAMCAPQVQAGSYFQVKFPCVWVCECVREGVCERESVWERECVRERVCESECERESECEWECVFVIYFIDSYSCTVVLLCYVYTAKSILYTCFNGYNKNAFKSFKIYCMLCFVDPLLHRSDTGYNHHILQLFCRTLGHIKIICAFVEGWKQWEYFIHLHSH